MKAATGVSAVFANGKATTKKASEVSSTESASLRSRRPAGIVDRKASMWFSAAVVIDAGIAICFQCPISRLAKDGQNALRFKSANLIEAQRLTQSLYASKISSNRVARDVNTCGMRGSKCARNVHRSP